MKPLAAVLDIFQGEKGVFPRIRNSSASADQALKTTETESLPKSRGYP